MPVAPPVFALLAGRASDLADRLGPVRLVLSGSAPLSRRADRGVHRAHRASPVHQGYGLTEAAPVVTSHPVQRRSRSRGSVGAALPGIEIRLVDEPGRAPEGEDPGEIQIRGDNLFCGYWPDGADGPDAEGWYATGDVGFLDADGDLFLVDRLKELVIVSGFNVYPSEVEDVIAEVAGVAEAAVIGVADERDRRGGGRLREGAPGRRRAAELEDAGARALRGPAGPVQAADRDRTSSTSCPTRSPARCRRAGCGPPSAAAPWACWSDGRMTARVTLYSKPGCHLCDDARAVIERGLRRARRVLRRGRHHRPTRSCRSAYGEEIPVTFVDGRQHDFWRVDADRLPRRARPAGPRGR